jgi:hypothetical protein
MASYFIDLPASTVSIPAGASTEAKQDSLITAIGLLAKLTDTQPVSIGAMTPTYAQSLVIGSGAVVTLTKPVGAKKAKVWAGSNGVNLRVTMDGSTTPTATTGFIFEPNRSDDFEGVGDLKVIAETSASNQAIHVHWSV